MIDIVIEGRRVAMPSDTEIQYHIDNLFVSQSEGYSFGIDIPLKCKENLEIFGFIFRKEADITKIRMNGCISCNKFFASGTFAIIGVTESEVKLQFLQGRSAQNFAESLDKVYINELELGTPEVSRSPRQHTPEECLRSIDDGNNYVTLPWVITGSGEYVHNHIQINRQTNELRFNPDLRHLSFMPYLIFVARQICTAIGYSHEFLQWEKSPHRFLLLCNVMPESLSLLDFAFPLPHWTVHEFFRNIEPVLQGYFDIDDEAKMISFRFSESLLENAGTIVITDVIDSHEVRISEDPENESHPDFLKNRAYAGNSGRFWPVRSCDWFIRRRLNNLPDYVLPSGDVSGRPGGGRGTYGVKPGWAADAMADPEKNYRDIVKFDRVDDLLKHAEQFRYTKNSMFTDCEKLLYAADVNCFFCFHTLSEIEAKDIPEKYKRPGITYEGWYYANELMPVNDFGEYIIDDDDEAEHINIEAVPVDVDMATGLCCFLPFSQADDIGYDDTTADGTAESVRQPKTFSIIMEGKIEQPEYYDKLYLGYWAGIRPKAYEYGMCPVTSNVTVYNGYSVDVCKDYDLRLNNGKTFGSAEFADIDFTKVYKFSFLHDSLPDPKAVFVICGKAYICIKLTAKLTKKGISQIIQGEFYRLPG